MEIVKEIQLTDEEKELFQNMEIIFDKVLNGAPYSLLVAGGWVRDKVSLEPSLSIILRIDGLILQILGLESNDIDVVVFGVTDLIALEADIANLKKEGSFFSNLLRIVSM